ncbi:hypothetical protein LXL04_002609 [Taraxacum kok-saghyz]
MQQSWNVWKKQNCTTSCRLTSNKLLIPQMEENAPKKVDSHDEKEEGRTTVRRKTNNKKGNLTKGDSDVTSLYVSNVPVGIRKGELWRLFKPLGNVVDVFIPSKKNNEGIRDHWCYGSALRGNNTPPEPVIELKKVTGMANWYNCAQNLFGVAKSLQQLRKIPDIMKIKDGPGKYIYYTGGLGITMRFEDPSLAKRFLDDKNTWGRWFSSLKQGEDEIPSFQRLAWLKVVGLPTQLECLENIEMIGNSWGKTLEVGELSWDKHDISYNRMCILTNHRKAINEKITIQIEKEKYRIGVSEIEVFWHPFKANVGHPMDVRIVVEDYENNENYSDDDAEDESEEEDVEEIYIEDMEEGEIIPENAGKQGSNEEASTSEPIPLDSTPETVGIDCGGAVPTTEGGATVDNFVYNEKSAGKKADETSRSNPDPAPIGPLFLDPVSKLVPLGWFGPFPSITSPFKFNSPQANFQSIPDPKHIIQSGAGLVQKKRKRVLSGIKKAKNSKLSSSPMCVRIAPPISPLPLEQMISLNQVVPPPAKDDAVNPATGSKSSEIQETAAIGGRNRISN